MAGDNTWMLTSSALVLMMTGPGLALFYCGLVRRKNVLGTMMRSFAMMPVITVLRGVGTAPNPTYAATIPHQRFMIYQLMNAEPCEKTSE